VLLIAHVINHGAWGSRWLLGPVFCSRKVVYCYLKYIHGAFIFEYVSRRTYFVENFDFPKKRGISLVVSTYKLNKILKKSPMTMLESPHPSPIFRTSLAVAKPSLPSSRTPRAVVDPHRTPLTVAELSSKPSDPSSKPSGRCRSPLAVVDPV